MNRHFESNPNNLSKWKLNHHKLKDPSMLNYFFIVSLYCKVSIKSHHASHLRSHRSPDSPCSCHAGGTWWDTRQLTRWSRWRHRTAEPGFDSLCPKLTCARKSNQTKGTGWLFGSENKNAIRVIGKNASFIRKTFLSTPIGANRL